MGSEDTGPEAFGLAIAVAVLLAVAAAGAVVISRGASPVGQAAGITAAVILVAVGVGCIGSRSWALGSAFFLGLFWAWATIALALQGRFTALEATLWLGWSVAVMVASVWARRHA